jgi:hypothetical protein
MDDSEEGTIGKKAFKKLFVHGLKFKFDAEGRIL